MKKLLAVLLLCLSLMGCAQGAPPVQPAIPARLAPTKETENDILRCYPLDSAECRFFTVGNDLWLVQNGELLCCEGKNLTCTVRRMLPNASCTVQPAGNLLCCYDPAERCVILMPQTLRLGKRIALPNSTGATPLLCPEGNHLYYRADGALMALDTNTGIHRLLRSEIPEDLTPTAVLESSGSLICSTAAQSIYLSAMDGSQQAVSSPVCTAAAVGSRDCIALQCGSLYLGSTMLTFPPEWRFLSFLPEAHSALLCRESPEAALAIYDLNTGNRTAYLPLGEIPLPLHAAAAADGRIFFQPEGTAYLYQWMPQPETFRDSRVRLSPVYTAEEPDRKGLEQCRARAAFIEKQYGLQTLLHTDALTASPGEYKIVPEHLPAIITDTLDRVEKALIRLPADFVRQLFGDSTFLCPVRSIRSADSQERNFLCYRSGNRSYLFLVADDHAEASALHCLTPLVDARILTCSEAFDSWEALNPPGFHYNAQSVFDTTAFVSPGSTQSPSDDRAEIWIAAMAPGNRERFTAAILQKKLHLLCTGLRAAFSLPIESLPWEQYLF